MDTTIPPSKRRTARWVSVLALVAVAVAACGGDQPPVIPFDASVDPSAVSSTTIGTSAATTFPDDTLASSDSTDDAAVGSLTSEAPPFQTATSWRNATANLAGMESDCGNLTTVGAGPGSGGVIAGVALRGLWRLQPGTTAWTQLGSGDGSATIANRPATILFDRDDVDTFWEAGNYNSNGVYRTDDDGDTFVQLGDIIHVDAVSVDMTDPLRSTMLASIHEQQDIWMSTDGGDAWSSLASNLPADIGNSNVPHIVDSSTFLLGSWLTATPGIFRSTDRGNTWERVFDGYVLELGLPLVLDDGTILWVLHNGAGVVASSDGGATWEQRSYVPLVSSIADMGDGRLAAVTADQVMVSADDGATWTWVGPATPFRPAAFAYSSANQAFYISQWDCGSVVLDDAVAELAIVSD